MNAMNMLPKMFVQSVCYGIHMTAHELPQVLNIYDSLLYSLSF